MRNRWRALLGALTVTLLVLSILPAVPLPTATTRPLLGFSEADLRGWIEAAGFKIVHFQITEPSPEYPDLEGLLAVGQKL